MENILSPYYLLQRAPYWKIIDTMPVLQGIVQPLLYKTKVEFPNLDKMVFLQNLRIRVEGYDYAKGKYTIIKSIN